MVADTFNPKESGILDLCEFEASLVSIRSSRITKVMWRFCKKTFRDLVVSNSLKCHKGLNVTMEKTLVGTTGTKKGRDELCNQCAFKICFPLG